MTETPTAFPSGAPLHQINISTGKDSLAAALVAKERADKRAMEMSFVFADTGNEDERVYIHLDYLSRALSHPIKTVRADFTGRFAQRRASLHEEWGKEKRRRKHRADCGRDGACECPMVISPPVPAHLIDRAIGLLHPTGSPFLDLCMLKGRFPSRRAQFCTEELKIMPVDDLFRPVLESGRSIIVWLGERAEESPNRARKPQLQRIRMFRDSNASKVLYRPIHKWTAAQTFEIAKRHGIKPNPLYSMGMSRVGCMPCINCSKNELAQIAKRFPEHIERIAEWERIVAEVSRRGQATFFPISTAVNGHAEWDDASIHNAVDWSRTSRGGRQYDLMQAISRQEAEQEGLMCESAYGLCE
jgi:3'-phosphoadenosine 5'-phosphosulfate sulfotransferase (PAPS reductase)/FAD synthetase